MWNGTGVFDDAKAVVSLWKFHGFLAGTRASPLMTTNRCIEPAKVRSEASAHQ